MAEKRENKSYRLLDDRSGTSFLLKVGRDMNLLIYDQKENVNKAIRHCPNEKSIFVEDQSKYAIVETIIFEHGYLEVPFNKPITQKFLDSHPDNLSNGGGWFEEVNDEVEASDYVDIEDLKHSIKDAIIQKSKESDGIYALEMVASVITGSFSESTSLSLNELKRIIYIEIENNPDYFVDEKGNVNIFDDQETQRKFIVLRALKDGIIKKSANGKTMSWGKTHKKIITAPIGVDLVDHFAEYLSTNEGILVAEEIKNRS